MDILSTCISGLSLNRYFQRVTEGLPSQFQNNQEITSSLRLYVICTQFIGDLRSSLFSHLYPSLYVWDVQNGVHHLQQQLWMNITQSMGGISLSSFLSRVQLVSSVFLISRWLRRRKWRALASS